MRKFVRPAGILAGVALIAIQLVPVERTNPAITKEVAWDSPTTRALAERACFDCHSNKTRWPWYSFVAPMSWRVADHVRLGRSDLNFSEWDQPNKDLDDVIEEIEEGEMPLRSYLRLHGEARLSEEEKEALIAGFRRTFVSDPPIERRRRPGRNPAGE